MMHYLDYTISVCVYGSQQSEHIDLDMLYAAVRVHLMGLLTFLSHAKRLQLKIASMYSHCDSGARLKNGAFQFEYPEKTMRRFVMKPRKSLYVTITRSMKTCINIPLVEFHGNPGS